MVDGITDSGRELEQAPGDGEGQGRLECCGPWGHKELDTTEKINNNSHCRALTRTDEEGGIRFGAKPHPCS